MLIRKFNSSELLARIFQGKELSLTMLHDLGLIESVVPSQHGEETILKYIKNIDHKQRVYSHFYTEKTKNVMVTYAELEEFKKLWLDVALHLSSKDLKRLSKVAYIQNRG